MIKIRTPILYLLPLLFLLTGTVVRAEVMKDADPPIEGSFADNLMTVGVARIDITPEGPIRLAGYGGRQTESEGVTQRLQAKALAFGSDDQNPSILITADLIGVPAYITERVLNRLTERTGLEASRLVIAASHTHTGPEVGNLLNHFRGPLPPDELGRINHYLDALVLKLESVALQALENRRPARLSRGEGEVRFAVNRRVLDGDRRWTGFGVVPNGPVDHSLPMLLVSEPDGSPRAVLVTYACHGTTFGGDMNRVHGDWMGEAQRLIEQDHPGVIALVSVGNGADANPEPRGGLEHAAMHGREIADEVNRLLGSTLRPLSGPLTAKLKEIRLPYSYLPGVDELVEQASGEGALGYYSRLALDRKARGIDIPANLPYPVQTWTFGNDLAMVFLAGEVVVDYTLRLRRELDADRLWMTAYVNDVPGYIPSRRILQEGGYEAESSMYSYDNPSPFSGEVEDLIITTIHELLPETFRIKE